MFEPNEESAVLEIVRNFFDVPSEDMMKIGDLTKNLLFGPGAESEEEAVEHLKAALQEMTKEQALMTGMFISGLLRCNLSQEMLQRYMQAMAEAEDGTEDKANHGQETKSD